MDFRWLTMLLALAVALAGCAADEARMGDDTTGDDETDEGEAGETNATAPEDYPEVAFDATQTTEDNATTYGFDGPRSAPAGWTRVTLTTSGTEPRQLVLLKLNEGVSYEEFVEAMMASADANATEAEQPFTPAGGVGGVTPGASGTVLLDLAEGSYAIVDMIPGPLGPHAFHGAIAPFNVTAADGEALPEPTPDATVTMREYAYTLPDDENLSADTRILAFTNEGEELHEAPMVRLEENATMHDFLEAIETPEGPPPGALVGGVINVPPGGTLYAVVDMESGTDYGFVCFFEAESDGLPHFVHGMVTQFTAK